MEFAAQVLAKSIFGGLKGCDVGEHNRPKKGAYYAQAVLFVNIRCSAAILR